MISPKDMQEIFMGGFQMVVACYLIGVGLGTIFRIMWMAVEK